MNNSNIRVVKCSVSPDNFINWPLLYTAGKIKPKEEVVENSVTKVELKNGLVNFEFKVERNS